MNSYLQPKKDVDISGGWASYDEAEKSFHETFILFKTRIEDLMGTRWDPSETQNTKNLSNIGLRNLFRSSGHESVSIKDLPSPVRDCLQEEDGKQCKGFQYGAKRENTKGVNNPLIRALGLNKEDHVTGWWFQASVFFRDGLFVYFAWDGQKNTNFTDRSSDPLAPAKSAIGIGRRFFP